MRKKQRVTDNLMSGFDQEKRLFLDFRSNLPLAGSWHLLHPDKCKITLELSGHQSPPAVVQVLRESV